MVQGADTSAPVRVGSTINYGSVGTAADIDCGDGESLNVGAPTTRRGSGDMRVGQRRGADNKITLGGSTVRLSVVGLE